MDALHAVYVGIPILTIGINAVLVYWIYTHHAAVRGARWFLACLVLGIVWMGFHTVTLLVVDPAVREVANDFATKAAVWSILAWLVFAAKYSHTDFHEHLPVRAPMLGIFAMTLVPTFLPPFDGLFTDDTAYPTEPFPHVINEPGVPFALAAVAIALLIAYGLYHLVRYMLATSRRSGLQLALLVFGSLSVEIVVALSNFGVFPVTEMNHASYGVLPFSVLTSLALFRFRLFDIQPVARNQVVEGLRDPVVVLDGNLDVLDFNRASTVVWPDLTEAIGQPIDDACPELADSLEHTDGAIVAPNRLSLVADGRERYYSLTVSTVDRGHSRDQELYTILLRDVTDLEQSRWQLEKQNERLDQVAATISHDLRNPINVAEGYAEMLEDVFDAGALDQAQREQARTHVGKIRSANERMQAIIDDVLTLAREGQAVGDTETVRLSAVARDAWETVPTGEATLEVADDRTMAADRSKFQTLLENLVRNAVEHAGPDVTVTVGALADGFYVTDDGPGIDEGDADAVFEYGYSTSTDGTGLGLSIVRTIAESHGWTVELDEADDGGARFVFRGVTVGTSADGGEVAPSLPLAADTRDT